MSAFRISESEECLIVKSWSKIVNDCREVLGGSKEKCNSSMMNQESYTCSMLFYLRESSRSDLASYHALSTCCPLMRVRVLRPELNLKE